MTHMQKNYHNHMLLGCIATLSQQYEAMHLIFERDLSDGLQGTAPTGKLF